MTKFKVSFDVYGGIDFEVEAKDEDDAYDKAMAKIDHWECLQINNHMVEEVPKRTLTARKRKEKLLDPLKSKTMEDWQRKAHHR